MEFSQVVFGERLELSSVGRPASVGWVLLAIFGISTILCGQPYVFSDEFTLRKRNLSAIKERLECS